MSTSSRPALPLPDWLRAIAAQLIIAHHLAWYGPLAVTAAVLAPELFAWLQDSARIAVQVFLVVGGYLAARALAPRPYDVRGPLPQAWPGLVLKRYLRLARPYGLALLAALVAAALARQWGADADTPDAPSVSVLLANVFFLQDVLGLPALSAGFWYVAIDLQLFALFAALVAWRRVGAPSSRLNRAMRVASLLGTGLLTVLSLFWFNLDAAQDRWAPYFFAAYGLGVLACWIQAQPRRFAMILALEAVVVLALMVAWRDRLALAGLVAVALAWQPGQALLLRSRLHPLMRWLAKVSYGSFLLHYPVLLVVGTVLDRLWPGDVPVAAAGLLLTWALSLAAGAAVQVACRVSQIVVVLWTLVC